MTKAPGAQAAGDFVRTVRLLIADRLEKAITAIEASVDASQLMPGKMLRTSLAGRLAECDCLLIDFSALQELCAATEIVHTASLCHDDIIDCGTLRRSKPTLWTTTGASGAILIGDLLLCQAMDILVGIEGGRYLEAFLAKIREVLKGEIEQELLLRGCQADEETCLRLARAKTGPLFAFVAQACARGDEGLSRALEEAGYRIGTAYQLADDLLDVVGDEEAAGKTLGTDSDRGKFTLPQICEDGVQIAERRIVELCVSALECVGSYSRARAGLRRFLLQDLQPILDKHGQHLDVSVRLAV